MTQPEWERSKENVAPLEEGRDVAKLDSALKATKQDLEAEKARHESLIQEAKDGKGPHANDPLAPCVAFAEWALQNYPSGSPVICAAIEKPCRHFRKVERYRDDPRLAKLWCRYANMRRDKLETYGFMYRNRIGETSALFYETWAAVLERARDFDKAEWVYNLGREKRAQPAGRLAQRQNEYFKRVAARAKRLEAKEQEKQLKNMVDTQRLEARNSRAPGRGRSAVADTLLASSSTSGNPRSSDENENPRDIIKKEPVRPALGTITDEEARTGHRPVSCPRDSQPAVKSQQKFFNSKSKASEKISVFSDKDEGSKIERDHARQDKDEMLKPMIAPRADISKEDDAPPTKWAGETLLQNHALKRRRAAANSTTPSFNIYQGDDDDSAIQDGQVENDGSGDRNSQIDVRVDKPSKLGLKRSAGGAENAGGFPAGTGRIETPALANDKKPASFAGSSVSFRSVHSATVDNEPKHPTSPTLKTRMVLNSFDDTVRNIKAMKSNYDNERPPSPTINTKMAFEAVDGTFNDTRTMNHPFPRKFSGHRVATRKGAKINKAAEPEPFVIFSDSNSKENSQLPSTKQPKLEIFVDIEADKENSQAPRAPQSIVPGPTSIPALEKRVLQPLPELEDKEAPVVDESGAHNASLGKKVELRMEVVASVAHNQDSREKSAQSKDVLDIDGRNKDALRKGVLEDKENGKRAQEKSLEDKPSLEQGSGDKDSLIEFLFKWFKSYPSCQILKEDPENFDGMFDLEPEHGTLVSLDPHCIHYGAEQKSIVILADDLNNVYGLKAAPEDSDDELSDIDDDAEPCIAVKVSNPENLWEFYIYRTLEERLGAEQFENSFPRGLAFFEGRSKSFMILSRIGLSSLADAPSVFGGNGMPEIVCAFLLSDLLKALEALHSTGIIHNDVTLDNVLVRDSRVKFNSGATGDKAIIDLSKEGVLLVDFNSSVDTRHPIVESNDAQALARFVAERRPGSSEYRASGCTEWAFNGDCYAAAVCAAKLLEVQVGDVTASGKNLIYESLWTNVFQRLCSLDPQVDANTTVACMRECRTLLDRAIAKDTWLHRHYRDFILMTGLKRFSEA